MSLLLAACDLKTDIFVDLAADGSGELTTSFLLDDDLADLIDFDPEDAVDELTEDGWRDVKVIEEDDLQGIEAARHFNSADILENEGILGADGLIEEARFDIGDDRIVFEGRSPDFGGELGDTAFLVDIDIDVELAIRFPGTVVEHNGDEIDGTTVIWRFDENDESRAIRATSEIGGFPWIPVGAVALGVVGAALFLLGRKSAGLDSKETPRGDVSRSAPNDEADTEPTEG